MNTAADEDEVKVFRAETDELIDNAQSSQQLDDDKKDVACEMDLETQATNNPCQQNLIIDPTSLSAMLAKQYTFPILMHAMTSPQYMNPLMSPMFASMLSPGFNRMNLGSPQYPSSAFMPPQMLPAYRPPIFNAGFNTFPFQDPRLHANAAAAAANSATPSHTPKRERAHREKRDKDHIKKPCNAFMLYMKENRHKFATDAKVKQSSELNKEMGKAWHELAKEEQEKYFDKARKAREEHSKLYPNWSARENYAINKKKRKKRERSFDPNSENNEMKKCRARFGIERQDIWCKSCRRKKRCLNVDSRNTESPVLVSSTTNPTTPRQNMGFGSPASALSTASSHYGGL